MRRAIIVLMVGLMAAFLVSCGSDEPEDAGTDAGSSAEDDSMEDHSGMDMQEEFVAIDGGENIAISSSCVDSSGTYNAELPDGGVFIFRNGDSSGSNIVDFQPSANADPLSSQTPEDTIVTVDGTFVTGTSTVSTEDGANSLSLDFGIVVDEANSC